MSNPGDITYWQSLAIAADSGQLYLNREAAAACHQACEMYISRLKIHQTRAQELANIDGWGEFSAGRQLRDVFAKKAVGGENNMVDVLQSHIDVVEEMKVVFRKFFVETTGTDDNNAAEIRSRGTG